jgi:mRNA-degrading endonuclease RelE of RelBE toxin-antitoxin system
MRDRTLKVSQAVRDLIRHLHSQIRRKVRDALNDILMDPACGKPLQRELEGYWSLRLGPHRIIYRPDNAGSEIVALGPRRTIYEETARHVMRERRGHEE